MDHRLSRTKLVCCALRAGSLGAPACCLRRQPPPPPRPPRLSTTRRRQHFFFPSLRRRTGAHGRTGAPACGRTVPRPKPQVPLDFGERASPTLGGSWAPRRCCTSRRPQQLTASTGSARSPPAATHRHHHRRARPTPRRGWVLCVCGWRAGVRCALDTTPGGGRGALGVWAVAPLYLWVWPSETRTRLADPVRSALCVCPCDS